VSYETLFSLQLFVVVADCSRMLELITEYYWLQNLRVTVTLCTIVKLRKDYLIIVILIALKCINTARAIFCVTWK